MDDGRRKLLRSMRVYLVNNLTRLEEVLDILAADHIISGDQRHRILCSSIPKDRVRNFLDIIVRCGPRAFNSFQRALEETNQESILDAIRTESFKLVPESVSLSVSARTLSPGGNQIIGVSTKPEKATFPTTQPFEPYNVTSVPHGYILIINVENYTGAAGVSNRLGSGEDVKKLRGLFEEFCYSVIVLQDPSGRQLEDAVRSFSQKPEHKTSDAGGLVVLAHGMEHHIIASDASLVKIDDLASCFTNASCPGLRGKPKLLIFQACRGVSIDHGIHSTSTSQAVGLTTVDHSLDPASWLALPHMSDCVIVYSTLPGFVSWRSETGGSLYISTFVDVFRLHGHHCHVMDLLAEVNNRLVQEAPELNLHQISQPVHTLRKPFYLSTKKHLNNSQS